MRIKRKAVKSLAVLLAATQCMGPVASVYAGTWESTSPSLWSYRNDDGTLQAGGWFKDPADGRWYYLDEAGVMKFGWQLIDSTWYFLNTQHDGAFGAALASGWFWIDGYCYYFDENCKMAANTMTPDGFTVDADGHWTENGVPVYVAGKGILTTAAGPGGSSGSGATVSPGGSSSSGGSGGGGGGGGGSSSSSVSYYDYTILYIDEGGNVLSSVDGEARKNSFITIPIKSFDGYTYTGGDAGAMKLTKDGAVFTLTYRTDVAVEIPDEDDSGDNTDAPEKEMFSYTIRYVDAETGDDIKIVKGTGKEGETIEISDMVPDVGYTAQAGNVYSFTLNRNNMEIVLYYQKDEETAEHYSYIITYVGTDGTLLGTIHGTAEAGDTVEIPKRRYPGYTESDGNDKKFILSEDGTEVEILYEKDKEDPDDASGSDADEAVFAYTITYIDKDTNDILLKEEGSACEGDIITPEISFDGYTAAAADYKFKVTEDGQNFTVYLVKKGGDERRIFANCKLTNAISHDTIRHPFKTCMLCPALLREQSA